MKTALLTRLAGFLALAGVSLAPVAAAHAEPLETAFDRAFKADGKAEAKVEAKAVAKAPRARSQTVVRMAFVPPPVPKASNEFEAQLYRLADSSRGRIGVAAMDLSNGRTISVLGDQPFPMASTSKIAIVATFLEGVDQGRWKLTDRFPMMMPVSSPKFAGPKAPVRPGQELSAAALIDLAITRSNNHATDALLAVVGGPPAVNRWLKNAGISGLRLDRDITTLVRDDGEFDPARIVDARDSATPLGMIELLSGLHEGRWLSASSRSVLIGAMERCLTGRHRIRAGLPEGTLVAHKTGTLNNTSSDVGFIHAADGHVIAVAIYVTGQGSHANRDARIASIARVIFDGYQTESSGLRRTASR